METKATNLDSVKSRLISFQPCTLVVVYSIVPVGFSSLSLTVINSNKKTVVCASAQDMTHEFGVC